MTTNPFIPGLNNEQSDKSSDCGSLILDGNSTRSKNSRFEKMRNSLRNTLFQPEKSRSLSTMNTSNLNLNNDDEKSAYTPTSDTHDNHERESSLGLIFTERNRGPKRSSMFCPETKNTLSLDRLSEAGEERHSYHYKGDNLSIVITPTERGLTLDDNQESAGFGSYCDKDYLSSRRIVEEAKYEDSFSLENGTFENRSMHSNGSPRDSDKRSSIFFRDIESEVEDIKRELNIENDPNIHFIKGNFYDDYHEEQILGEGTTGTVKRIVKKGTNQAFAVKVVHYRDDLEMIYLIVREFKNQKKLNHKNIIKVYDLYIDYFKKKIYTVMELAECREMFDVVKDLGHYSEAVASGIFKQILTSISYLHSNGVCHRDLKPNNILVSEDGKTLKIADFNVSKFLDNKKEKFSYLSSQNHRMWTYTGTIAFTAPEVFNESEYTEAVDMWSAGVVLYTMLCGYQPFQAEYVSDLIEQIKAGKFEFPSDPWDNISKQAKNLVKHLIDANPKTRYSPAQALMHPWIANNGIVSNTNIPRTQYYFKRNCRRNTVRTHTHAPYMNKSGKKNYDLHGRKVHNKEKDVHKDHKPHHILSIKENNLNKISETSETDQHDHHTVNSLYPKRGKTGPEGLGIQSFHNVFPVKMERSFSFSALEDDEHEGGSDEDDDHHGHKDLDILHGHDLIRSQSHFLSPTLQNEDILKNFMPNIDREKLSPLIAMERKDKENIEPEKRLQDRIMNGKMSGIELNKENIEDKPVLGIKFLNEPSKAQE